VPRVDGVWSVSSSLGFQVCPKDLPFPPWYAERAPNGAHGPVGCRWARSRTGRRAWHEKARVHHAARRRCGVAARGAPQICPLLKVNRPCHLAAATSQFDPRAVIVGRGQKVPQRVRARKAQMALFSGISPKLRGPFSLPGGGARRRSSMRVPYELAKVLGESDLLDRAFDHDERR